MKCSMTFANAGSATKPKPREVTVIPNWAPEIDSGRFFIRSRASRADLSPVSAKACIFDFLDVTTANSTATKIPFKSISNIVIRIATRVKIIADPLR